MDKHEIRVVVTGIGMITPLGNTVTETWQAAINGQSGVGHITHYDPSEAKVQIAAEVKGFDADEHLGRRESRRTDRFTQFALLAAEEAFQMSGLVIGDTNRHRVGAVMGSGIGGIGTLLSEAYRTEAEGLNRVSPHMVPMMLPDTAPGKIAIEYGLRGPNMSIVTACASGTNAIGEAAAMIRQGRADAIVTGGAEAAILPLVLAGFANMGALADNNDNPEAASRPFDADRRGFVAGEGASVLILEREDHARERGATILGEILGYGASADAYHITAPHETGAGAILAIRAAIQDAGITPDDIDYINAHGTSTVLNDKSETIAIKAALGAAAYNTSISSTKSMTGHLLGAAGALEAAFCLLAIKDEIIPPTINYTTPDPDCDLDYTPNTARKMPVRVAMSNSFGFGGHNATIIIGAYEA